MHQIGDPVYSNSFGLGYISKIQIIENFYKVRHDRFHVKWMDDSISFYADDRWYESHGIDTLKMFLRMKLRGEDI